MTNISDARDRGPLLDGCASTPVTTAGAEGAPDTRFKIATEPWELEQVHRLNYQTFVEEIPQHAANAERRLVDKFHDQNVYVVAVRGREVLAMTALRLRRPFSLDAKLPDLGRHLPPAARRVAEVRLLATRPAHRGGRLFLGLMSATARHLASRRVDTIVISGTTRQQKLYRRMGFIPFGPLVGS